MEMSCSGCGAAMVAISALEMFTGLGGPSSWCSWPLRAHPLSYAERDSLRLRRFACALCAGRARALGSSSSELSENAGLYVIARGRPSEGPSNVSRGACPKRFGHCRRDFQGGPLGEKYKINL